MAEQTLYILGEQHTYNIMNALQNVAMSKKQVRFSDLKIKFGEKTISDSVLSNRLKQLEKLCLITKNSVSANPPFSEYKLTNYGNDMLELARKIVTSNSSSY